MSIDKADWHADTLPADLPEEAAATHIGLFLAWAIQKGHAGEEHARASREALQAVRDRRMTGREFFLAHCDAKLIERDLTPGAVAFAEWYYSKRYFTDYERTLCRDLPSMYHVADSWESYDRLAPVLDQRFDEWRRRGERRWWQFWKR